MERDKVKAALLDYLPAIATLLIGILTEILYATAFETHKTSAYLAVAAISLVPFGVVFFNRLLRLGFPLPFILAICLHLVLAVDIGTAMGVYKLLWWWDLFVHGYFGFIGCGVLYYLYIRFEGAKPKIRHFVVFLLVTIALATFWEIYEYVADLFLHSDMQGIESAIAQGIPPLTDTITDIAIALAGGLCYCAVPWIKGLVAKKKGGTPAN